MHIRTVGELEVLKPTMKRGSEVYCYKTIYLVRIQKLFILYSD